MADYDSGEVTDRERLAADRQKEISRFNADAVKNQLARQMASYDTANAQNRALADTQIGQARRKAEDDRFLANRNLQNSALSLLGSLGSGLNGSSTGNLMRMLENRNDSDNVTYWGQLQQDRDQVENAYQEAFNQNNMAKLDAATNAEKALRDIEADLSANLSNINPNLYQQPGIDDARFYSDVTYNENVPQPNLVNLMNYLPPTISGRNRSGYIMPDNSMQEARQNHPRNRVRRGGYFGSLVNGFNQRGW